MDKCGTGNNHNEFASDCFCDKCELSRRRARIRELEQALQEIGKHAMESEDDIDFIIDACRNALRVADRAAG